MKILNKMKFIALLLIVLMQFVFIVPVPKAQAATSPSLGVAANFSVLAGTEVTNTGTTTTYLGVGVSPGTSITGQATLTAGGGIHSNDASAISGQADQAAAYTALAAQGCTLDYGGVTTELAGKNLVPGVYCSTSFHLTTGTLTLNGTASDVWIFKSGSDLIITGGAASSVVFTGGGLACNVWWRVVSTATFDANSSLVGNILADTSITMAAGASLDGRALARTAEVTLSSNTITGPACAAGQGGSSSSSSGSGTDASGASTTVCPVVNFVTPLIIESRRIDADSIFFSWGPYSGTNTFIIQYGYTSGNLQYSTRVTGFSTTINGLSPNQPIWVRIASTDNCSIGNYGTARLVGGPGLPNTGLASRNNIPWSIAMPAGIVILILASLVTNICNRKSYRDGDC